MSELTEQIQEFEQGVSGRTLAIEEKLRASRKCQQPEEVLLSMMDFLILLDAATLTEQQISQRQALIDQANALLPASTIASRVT